MMTINGHQAPAWCVISFYPSCFMGAMIPVCPNLWWALYANMDHPAKGHAYLKSAGPKVQYNHGFAVMSTNSIWARNMALVPGGLGGGSWGDVYICFRGNDHGSDRYLVIKFARFAGRLHILHTSNPMKLAFSGAQIDDIWLTREKSPIFCLFLPQAGHLSRRLHAWISGRLGGGLRARPTGAAALQL